MIENPKVGMIVKIDRTTLAKGKKGEKGVIIGLFDSGKVRLFLLGQDYHLPTCVKPKDDISLVDKKKKSKKKKRYLVLYQDTYGNLLVANGLFKYKNAIIYTKKLGIEKHPEIHLYKRR